MEAFWLRDDVVLFLDTFVLRHRCLVIGDLFAEQFGFLSVFSDWFGVM